jgi:hypothetical protein
MELDVNPEWVQLDIALVLARPRLVSEHEAIERPGSANPDHARSRPGRYSRSASAARVPRAALTAVTAAATTTRAR